MKTQPTPNHFFSKIILPFLLVIVVVFYSCNNHKKEATEHSEKNSAQFLLKDFMVGNWETTYIKIEYPTYKNTDSLYVFEEDFSNPDMGKAQSAYNTNGTFTAWFLQPNGTKVGETSGVWKTKKDSLFVNYPYLGKQVQAWYHIQKTTEGFEGKVVYDWDDDGEMDDTLIMKTKQLQNH